MSRPSPPTASRKAASVLLLHGRLFSIVRGEICGVVPPPGAEGDGAISWSLFLQAGARSCNNVLWRPSLTQDDLSFPRGWRSIAGARFRFSGGADNGLVSVWEHVGIARSALVFGARDGFTFGVDWRGDCALGHGSWFETGAFRASTRATLSKLYVHGRPQDGRDAYRERVARHVDPADFDQGEIETLCAGPRGRGLGRCAFTPRMN